MLPSYQQSVASFSQMNYDQKKAKVIAMLEVLKEEWNIFEDLWNLVHINERVSEWVLDMIYQVITKAMYTLKEEEMEWAIEKLEWIRDKVANIDKQAQAEQAQAEDVLNQLD